MQIGDPIYENGNEVGKICHISFESLFVRFNERRAVERFHQFIFNDYLKSKDNLSDFDKITNYTIKQK